MKLSGMPSCFSGLRFSSRGGSKTEALARKEEALHLSKVPKVSVIDAQLAPSSNEWGIPDLDPYVQPSALVAPLVAWGSVSRKTPCPGTWHFYVDDRRFASPALAASVIASTPRAAVEPNYSVFEWTPLAEALYSIYRKRRVAWQLQRHGIPVFVDLCLPRPELAFIGVPKGWAAFATRGFEAQVDDLEREYRCAADCAAGRPLFVVYGGGRKVREACRDMPGAVHVPDYMTQRRKESVEWAREQARLPEVQAKQAGPSEPQRPRLLRR